MRGEIELPRPGFWVSGWEKEERKEGGREGREEGGRERRKRGRREGDKN